jgi:hypothetical protein
VRRYYDAHHGQALLPSNGLGWSLAPEGILTKFKGFKKKFKEPWQGRETEQL